MTKLSDLFVLDEFGQARAEGYIRLQSHPVADLHIANYSEKAMYEKHWTPVTTQCRGLIFDNNGAIVARSWTKFHNYGEFEPGYKWPSGPVEVTDKMDGSLGILYRDPILDAWAIATRGSFTSPQALRGTEMLQDHLKRGFAPDPAITYLFEIVYAENRIVLSYDFEGLVLLGGVSIEHGHYIGPLSTQLAAWNGRRTKVFHVDSLSGALNLADRPNAEGVVVRFMQENLQVKLKQEDYVAAHAVVTGMHNRNIWEILSRGENLPEKASFMPDEFYSWMQKTAMQIQYDFETWKYCAEAKFSRIMIRSLSQGDDRRKQFAKKAALKGEYRAAMFKLYDGQSIDQLAWKAVRPAKLERPYNNVEQ